MYGRFVFFCVVFAHILDSFQLRLGFCAVLTTDEPSMRIELRAIRRSSGICDPGFCATVLLKRGRHVR